MDSRTQVEMWFRRYSDDVYRFLVFYTGTRDVEDLLQETFIRAFKGFRSYKGTAQPKTWLISIARRTAIDQARRRRAWKDLIFKKSAESVQSPMDPERLLLENEDKMTLYRDIGKLKKEYRDVVLLRFMEGLSVPETAEVMGWTEAKVSLTLHRAIHKLQLLQTHSDGRLSYETGSTRVY